MSKIKIYLLIFLISEYIAQIGLFNSQSSKIKSFFDDKKINIKEKVDNFKYVNINNEKMVDLIYGNLRKLENSDNFKLKNFIIFLILIFLVVVIILIVLIVLMCKKKDYPSYQNISEENKKLPPPQDIDIKESNESKDLGEDKVVDDTKVTNEEVEFLKNIMKKNKNK